MTESEPPLSRRARREAEAAAARRGRRRAAPESIPEQPATAPETVDPLVTEPPATAALSAQLLAMEPPATEPLATGLPATGLPATEVLATESPATELLVAGPEGVSAPGEPSEVTASSEAGETGPRGIAAFVRAHPRAVLATALGVGFLLLASGSLFAGIAVGSAQGAPAPVPSVTASVEAEPRILPAAIADPSRLRTCSIAGLAADERLGSFFGSVVNASTGEVLFDRSATSPVATGSVMKVLTGAAALAVLGSDYRMSTRVIAGTLPGSVVLVGGGDATLSRLPAGQESVYSGAPKLDELAEQVVAAFATANPDEPGITTLVIDATYWNAGDAWNPGWSRDRIAAGVQAPATALMVDGDRDDPRQQLSPRSNDPVARAAQAFAEALAEAGNPAGVPTITSGAAVGGTVLGQVQSQPVSTLVSQMLSSTDFVLAEMLARVISKQQGLSGGASSLTAAITGALNPYGVPTEGIAVSDGSGLATDSVVPARYLSQLFAVINGRSGNLGIIMDALPVAGVSGSLASRFGGPNAVARGAVTAMPGELPSVQALAGVVRAADGSVLTVGLSAVRDAVGSGGRDALDSLTAAVFTCGDNLSNN